MRIKSIILVILVLSVLLTSFSQIDGKAESKTIVVPDDYVSIQEAMVFADDGDTIFVKKGIYDGPLNETLIFDKPISITGEGVNATILNLHPELVDTMLFYQPYQTHLTSIIIESNDVFLSGLTINSPVPGGGISINGNGTKITDCKINCGSMTVTGSFSIISKTVLSGALRVDGSNQTIAQCEIKNIVRLNGYYNRIIGNVIDSQVELTGSYNLISENSFSKIFLEYSNSNIIQYNTFSCIWVGYYGHTSSNNTIAGNLLDGGYIWGILMGDGSYNIFHDNLICNYSGSHDGYGIAVGGTHLVAEYNTFYRNILINNNRNVATNWEVLGAGNFWDNGEVGNYWDNYIGTDVDGDGIGDAPYIVEGIKRDDGVGGHVDYIFGQDNFPLMEPFDIETIPEFPSSIVLPLFLIATILIIVSKIKLTKIN